MTVDGDGVDRLRKTLAEVAAAHEPDAYAWARIHDRVEAGDAPVVELARPERPRRRFQLLSVAAAVLALLAFGAAVATTGDRNASHVATDPGTAPTGWYVPAGLPDGWQLSTVTATRIDDACPCRTTVWQSADHDRFLIAVAEAAGSTDGVTEAPGNGITTTTFDLGSGVEATLNGIDATPDDWDVSWTNDGQYHAIQANGLPKDQAEDIARAVFAHPATRSIPVSGLDVTGAWHEPGKVGRNGQVEVTMKAPSGHPVSYTLQLPRGAVPSVVGYEAFDGLEGQALPTLRSRVRTGSDGFGQMVEPVDFMGRWPGATVRSGGSRVGGPDGTLVPTNDEVEVLMASLRPATAEAWRTFAGGAQNRDRAVTASVTLDDLVMERSAAPAATSEPPSGAGELADLGLTLTAEPQLASWEDAGVELTVRNPTATAIRDPSCALDHAQVALFPWDSATKARVEAIGAGDLWWQDRAPCDGGVTIQPGGSKTIRLVVRAQFPDARYGPLPSGRYQATVRIDGVDERSRPRVPVTIVGEGCSNGAEDFIGLTGPEAGSLAAERSISQFRVLDASTSSAESEVRSDRCDRINVILGNDGRVVFARTY